jgi:hypothetical protein
MKVCSLSRAIKKCKSKLHYDSTLLLLEQLPSRTPPTTNVGKDVRKKKLSYTTAGYVS